ncbi:MAG: Hexaprenyldihydroxybenzoate methyltransferase, mitochondrial [Peltula sp. TS41687]|nr:MAG: Hexaprenyldihydroxybenzoate methyltransferase, mitochondrial [Peltula sp. TS41687]
MVMSRLRTPQIRLRQSFQPHPPAHPRRNYAAPTTPSSSSSPPPPPAANNHPPGSSSPSHSSSVDPTEISHFNALASTWWDPHGPSRLLHQMNPLRHQFIQSCLSNTYDPFPHRGLRYLDVGCGGGIFSESAARLPHTEAVVGIDPSAAVVAVARRHARRDPSLCLPGLGPQDLQGPQQKLTYIQTSIEDFPQHRPQSAEQFDAVTLFEVIEHVTHPAPFLEACLPLVRPGGWLVLSTIARTWTSWLTTKVVAEDVLGIVPRGTHDWRKYVNEEELRGWFGKRVGWGRTRAMGVAYVPALGWRELPRGERWGNYFFGVRRDDRV